MACYRITHTNTSVCLIVMGSLFTFLYLIYPVQYFYFIYSLRMLGQQLKMLRGLHFLTESLFTFFYLFSLDLNFFFHLFAAQV